MTIGELENLLSNYPKEVEVFLATWNGSETTMKPDFTIQEWAGQDNKKTCIALWPFNIDKILKKS